MRIAIVDDEEKWVLNAKLIIDSWSFTQKDEINTIDVYYSGIDYLKNKTKYDVTFVDIQMEEMDGFATISKAREYNQEGIFIILTTHNELSSKGYLVNAFRYIDKLKMKSEMLEALNSVASIFESYKRISVNVINEGQQELRIKDILYIETEKRYILVHTEYGTIRCSNTIMEIEKMLLNTCFYRCHKAIIVNVDQVKKLDYCTITMKNEAVIYAAKRRATELKRLYVNRKYKCANA